MAAELQSFSTTLVGVFYTPQIYDMGPTALFPLRRKCALRIFIALKNIPFSARFEPASGKHATVKPPRAPYVILCYVMLCYAMVCYTLFLGSEKRNIGATHGLFDEERKVMIFYHNLILALCQSSRAFIVVLLYITTLNYKKKYVAGSC
jgi:hypothetical protein